MNLQFVPIKAFVYQGRTWVQEKALATSEFWRYYRSGRTPDMQRVFTLQFLPDKSGTLRWYVFRNRCPDTRTVSRFKADYTLRSRKNLLPYQERAVSHIVSVLASRGAALDGSDTGLGKTYVSLAVCREMGLRPVVICKKIARDSWADVCRYMGVSPLVIVHWEYARQKGIQDPVGRYILRARPAEMKYRWAIPANGIILFDEAHMGQGKTQQGAMYTASRGIRSISISATIADRVARLRNLFTVLNIMGQDEYDNYLMERGCFLNQGNDYESGSETDDLKALSRILYPDYGYRLAYTDPDVAEYFPGVVRNVLMLRIGSKNECIQNKMYRELVAQAATYTQKAQKAVHLVADLRYRQAAELMKVRPLIETVSDYLKENKAVIVFVNFIDTLKALAKALNTNSLIYGEQEKDGIDRQKVISSFQSGRTSVIISMIDAGGASISLHDTHGGRQRVSLICPTYNSTKLKQVMGRTYRAQAKSIPIISLVYARGTIEQKVALRVMEKLRSIDLLNDADLTEDELQSMNFRGE